MQITIPVQSKSRQWFEKRFIRSARALYARILGEESEKIARRYLKSQGFEVCRPSFTHLLLHQYSWMKLPIWTPRTRNLSSCPHISRELATEIKDIYLDMYSKYRTKATFESAIPFDFLAHKNGQHYAVEVKTSTRIEKGQREFLSRLAARGVETIGILVPFETKMSIHFTRAVEDI